MHVMWNGDVPPCCIVKDKFIGRTEQATLAEIFNSDAMKDYRMGLLTGDLPEVCKACTYMPDTDTDALTATVADYLKRPG